MLNRSQRNKDEYWTDIFYPFLFLSHQLLAPVAGKKNKFISFRERSSDNHTQFQTKMFKIYTRFKTAHTYVPDIAEYPPPPAGGKRLHLNHVVSERPKEE